MSTVFYGFRVKKSDWWVIHEKIRHEYWNGESTAAIITHELIKQHVSIDDAWKAFTQAQEMLTAEIQVFEFGDDYVFRVLERGWFFQNKVDQWKLPITREEVDTRTDWPEGMTEQEQDRLLALVDAVDVKIKKLEYFLVHLVTLDELKRHYFDKIVDQKTGV